ncbi:MAG: metallophosphoesterase [Victivallales bacterium]|nr:metallophosphoesterase [Victivallales bacterium]
MTMTENRTAPLLLIADSHVQPNTKCEDEFFSMLDWIASTNYDVFFLGDNLDLWIASGSRYEADAHRRFLAWCEREKARRRVLMVEGNHEFYLKRHHDGCFTACSETFYKIGDILFMHGDVAQKRFGFHRCFRVFAKNAFGDWVMGWLPFGPAFAGIMKRFLSSGGLPDLKKLEKPLLYVEKRAKNLCRKFGVSHIIMGHFHHVVHRELGDGRKFDVIPAWKYRYEVGVLAADGSLEVLPWMEVKMKNEQRG